MLIIYTGDMNALLKQASLKVRNDKAVGIRVGWVGWECILLGYRANNIWIVLKKFVENRCRTAGVGHSTDSEVEAAQIWVRGVMARCGRKMYLCAIPDS